jgi:tape measure domain-containing protein
MSDEAIKIEITGRIDGKIAASIRDIATAALTADSNLDLLKQSLRDVSNVQAFRTAVNDTRELRTEIVKVTQASRTFATTNNTVSQSLIKTAQSADKYALSLKRVDAANNGLEKGFGNLRGAIAPLVGMFASVFAIQQYAQAQDALTGIQNKIRSLTDDFERQRDIQTDLFELSNRTRTSVEATTDGFVRFSKAMKDATDEEVLRFVETLNKSLISAGRTTGEVNSIVIQLGQALTSGRLMGDEFRSLSENLPREALQAIADQLGVGVEKLKELSSQGLITTEVLRAAFADLGASMDEQFNRTIPSIGQALTVLNNQFIAFTEGSAAGAQLVSSAIIFLGNNLNTVIPMVALFAAAWAAVQLVKIATDIIGVASSMIRMAGAFTAANLQILLVVASVAALVAIFLAATGQLEPFLKWLKDDLPKAIGEWIGKITETATATDTLGTSLTDMEVKGTQAYGAINTGAGGIVGTIDQGTAANEHFANTFQAVQNSAGQAYGTINQIGTGGVAAINAGTSAAGELTGALAETESQANSVISALQGIVSWVGSALSAIASLVNSAAKAIDDFTGADGSGVGMNNPDGSKSYGAEYKGAYANGGSFTQGGNPGIDKNLVAMRVSRGERVDVLTPAQQRAERNANDNSKGGNTTIINMNIQTPNADSFRLSRGQIASDAAAGMGN